MYNDILGEEEEEMKPTNDSIISELKHNIKEKERFINSLLDRITELEQQVEYHEQL